MTAGESMLQALRGVCGPGFARAGGPADTVAGRPARLVAAPGTAEAAVAVLRLAAANGYVVVPRGAGTKIDWGAPTGRRVDVLLDTGRLAGVLRHTPEELSAEVGAGTPVRAVQASLARHGQRVAIDPPSSGATLGGVLAVDESGPLRHAFGTPRKQVLAVARTDREGQVVRAAGGYGRVPGDPAGAGGVLLSATLRLQPAPAARRWVSRSVWTPLEVHDLVGRVLDAKLSPAAVEVDLPGPAGRSRSAGARTGTLAVLIEGGPASVDERARSLVAAVAGETSITAVAPPWWGRYPFTPDDVAVRVTVRISDLYAAVYALIDAAGSSVPVRGSAGQGVVHAALPGDTPPPRVAQILEAVRGVLLARGGRCVVIAAPPGVRDAVELEPGTASD